MTALKSKPDQERRAARRVNTQLAGRYMLSNWQEYPCWVLNISLTGLLLQGPKPGAIGEKVIVYADQLGRVQGEVVRATKGEFAIRLTSTTAALEKLASKLRRLEAKNALVREEERRDEPRVEPDLVPFGRPEETKYRVLNVSVSGAEIGIDDRPPLGEIIEIGQLRGKVVRHTTSGIAVEFIDVPDGATLTARIAELALRAAKPDRR